MLTKYRFKTRVTQANNHQFVDECDAESQIAARSIFEGRHRGLRIGAIERSR